MMKVNEVMTRDVQSCTPQMNLATAAMLMWDNDCGVLPVVVDGAQVIGVITDRDICMAAATKHRDASNIAVSEVISGSVYACKPDEDVRAALKIMRQERVRRVPVIDTSGNLMGILSMNDVTLKAKETNGAKTGFSYSDVMKTYKAVCAHPEGMPQQAEAKTAAV